MNRHPRPLAPAALIAAAIGLHAAPSAAASSGARRLTALFPEPVPGRLLVSASPARVGDTLFFPGWDPKNQWAMWSSDGSADRAALLRGSRAQTPVAFDGQAFYVGSDATASRLFVSDGTPAGTRPVAELGAAQAGSLTAAAGGMYLRGGDAHPWRSDGTAAGTLRLTDRASLSDAPGFVAWNGAVWFLALGDDGHLGLWATRGTPQATGKVADLDEASAAGRFAYGLAASPRRLYFYTSQEPRGASYRLWSSDGSASGTSGLHDFTGTFASPCPVLCFGIGPETLAVLGAELVFVADDSVHGREIWETDGSAVGTRLLADGHRAPRRESSRRSRIPDRSAPRRHTRSSPRTTASTAGSSGGRTGPRPAPTSSRTSCRAAAARTRTASWPSAIRCSSRPCGRRRPPDLRRARSGGRTAPPAEP